jgi:hypothetical protein
MFRGKDMYIVISGKMQNWKIKLTLEDQEWFPMIYLKDGQCL